MFAKMTAAKYVPSSGISKVTVESKWGSFTCTVMVAEEDKDIANQWDGCKIAARKALIKILEAKSKAMWQRVDGVYEAINALGGPWAYPKLERQYYVLWERAKECEEEWKTARDDYPDYIDRTLSARREFRESLDKEEEEEDND